MSLDLYESKIVMEIVGHVIRHVLTQYFRTPKTAELVIPSANDENACGSDTSAFPCTVLSVTLRGNGSSKIIQLL